MDHHGEKKDKRKTRPVFAGKGRVMIAKKGNSTPR